jgi:hypothetical protein
LLWGPRIKHALCEKVRVTNSHFIILLLLRVLLSVEFLNLTPTDTEAERERLFSHNILTPAIGQMRDMLTDQPRIRTSDISFTCRQYFIVGSFKSKNGEAFKIRTALPFSLPKTDTAKIFSQYVDL